MANPAAEAQAVYCHIAEISTDKASGHLYALVHFWASKADYDALKPSMLTNDFLMQLRPGGNRIVTNEDGWLKRLSDGKFIDPLTLKPDDKTKWAREDFTRDVPSEIKANIESYWKRAIARGDAGSKIHPRIERDDSDPYLILARADVRALRDAKIEVLEAERV